MNLYACFLETVYAKMRYFHIKFKQSDLIQSGYKRTQKAKKFMRKTTRADTKFSSDQYYESAAVTTKKTQRCHHRETTTLSPRRKHNVVPTEKTQRFHHGENTTLLNAYIR